MKKGLCAIWGTLATIIPTNDGDCYDSERAGGQYRIEIASGVKTDLISFDDAAKARLTTWILDENRSGVRYPLITEEVLKKLRASKPMRLSKKIERFFLCLYDNNVQIETALVTKEDQTVFLIEKVCQYCEIKSLPELRLLRSILKKMGTFSDWDTLSFEGINLLEKYTVENIDSKQVFVAMWFDQSMNEIYDQGFEPGIQSDTGLQARRIDRIDFLGKIDDEILAEIRRSKFVVADFTCGETVRGGVYYEAGFAQGLGKSVIFTCHKDKIDQLHFDTRQFNHIVWNDAKDLSKQLNNRIKAMGLSHL